MTHLITKVNPRWSGQIKKVLNEKGISNYDLSSPYGTPLTVLQAGEKDLAREIGSICDYVKVNKPYILVSREFKPESTVIPLGYEKSIGGNRLAVMAGPCAVESETQMTEAALAVKEAGASLLRGGAFKPRSSPYAFQGLGEEGLKLLKRAGEAVGLPVITEIMDSADIPLLAEYADVLQVGARNCQNFSLLKKLGKINKPVLLKRGSACTIEELLSAAEYILAGGNGNVILCERGIRTFETATRNTLDISAIALLKMKTHLPVIADPSHAAGDPLLIEPLSKAAIACGADGLMIEVHPHPEEALCDGKQSLKPEVFGQVMESLKNTAFISGKEV